jgi:hypothetical protein
MTFAQTDEIDEMRGGDVMRLYEQYYIDGRNQSKKK